MTPAAHMLSALGRASFLLGLVWRSPGTEFLVRYAPDGAHITDACAFAPGAPWVELEAFADTREDTSGPVRLTLRIPAPGARDPLRLANAVNRAAAAPVHYDEEAGVFIARGAIVFAGYHQPEADLAFCRTEATLNLFIATFSAAQRCVALLTGKESA